MTRVPQRTDELQQRRRALFLSFCFSVVSPSSVPRWIVCGLVRGDSEFVPLFKRLPSSGPNTRVARLSVSTQRPTLLAVAVPNKPKLIQHIKVQPKIQIEALISAAIPSFLFAGLWRQANDNANQMVCKNSPCVDCLG